MFTIYDAAVYRGEDLMGEFEEGRFIPSRLLLEEPEENHKKVDEYLRTNDLAKLHLGHSMRYYMIKVGDNIRTERAANPRAACMLAFGTVYDEATFKDLGTRSPKNFNDKKKEELQSNTGWLSLPK